MPKFVKLSKPDWGGAVYVNADAVRYLRAEKTTKGTMIVFDKEQLLSVAEDIETVARELDETSRRLNE